MILVEGTYIILLLHLTALPSDMLPQCNEFQLTQNGRAVHFSQRTKRVGPCSSFLAWHTCTCLKTRLNTALLWMFHVIQIML